MLASSNQPHGWSVITGPLCYPALEGSGEFHRGPHGSECARSTAQNAVIVSFWVADEGGLQH
eukprot:7774857-Alexandrium_andersonii.AAC.1